MHVILRWLKIRSIEFLLNFGSKYWSRGKIPSWLTLFSSKILRCLKIHFCLKFYFSSNFEPSQGFRAKKKWANSSRNLTETELIEFWAISGSHACSNLWQISFDDFLSYLRVRPVCSISSLFRIGLGQFQSLLANFGLARISLERFLVRFGLVLLWS